MSTRIIEPGIFRNLPAKDYHGDPCDAPSLSCTLARLLLQRSPAHAKAAHPRLGRPEPEEYRFNLGSVVHEMLLGGTGELVEVEAKTYQSNDAKSARDAALRSGLIPVLTHQMRQAEQLCEAIRARLKSHPELSQILQEPALFETSAFWKEEAGFWCRCRPDILFTHPYEIFDLKITGLPATPRGWAAYHAWSMGYVMRAAWYRRGLAMTTGGVPRYVFVVLEDKPPYGLAQFECSPEALAIGEAEVELALTIWGECMLHEHWPSYTPSLQWINPLFSAQSQELIDASE